MLKSFWIKSSVVWSVLALSAGFANAQFMTELEPETKEVFDAYIRGLESGWRNAAKDENIVLWMDNLDRRTRTRSGDIIVERIEEVPDVPKGILHYWVGAMFVPDVTGQKLVDLLMDFDSHKNVYPEVVDSKLLERSDNVVKSFLRLKKKQVVTVVLNTEHEAEIFRPEKTRWFIASRSTRIVEVKDADTSEEEELPVDQGHGFVWRMNAYWVIEEVEDGVMVTLRSITLSRDIPWVLRAIIGPFVRRIPRAALEETLEATRARLIR